VISIKIDPSPIVERYSLSQDDINDLMDFTIKEITRRFANALEIEANNTLKEARLDYISNIHVIDEGFAKGSVVLTGWLPNAIENGKPAWDMKPDFLSGPNAKITASGTKYNTIPFSHGTPDALEENFNGGIMPDEVYDIVKNKPIREDKNTSLPIVKDELPKALQEPQAKKVKMPSTGAIVDYKHKNSIYEGIRKERDNTTKQNRYTSFRRVSENSDPASWIHPGFPRTDLFGKTLLNFNIPQEIGRILDEVF
jgi:hypothetical protein